MKTPFLLFLAAGILLSAEVRPLPKLAAGKLYGVTVSIADPAALPDESRQVRVRVSDAQGEVVSKTLHASDLDLYFTLKPRQTGAGKVEIDSDGPLPKLKISAIPMAFAANIVALPAGSWREAHAFELGQTQFGSNDERPYVPAPGGDIYKDLVSGFQWLEFTPHGSEPKLVYFALDFPDRDVPGDVEIYTRNAKGDDVEVHKNGKSIYGPEATQNYPGLYKFRTAVVQPGTTYYLRVAADHPSWQLRTFLYPVPPYQDPHLAVRAGMDFLIDMGDSWHANTPRRGSVALRSSMPHSETQLCIACHPTQFTLRGYLKAVENGYPVRMRPAVNFIAERLYNNPRPLYGEDGANWVRVIYSARTVASRIPWLLDLYEKNVSFEPSRPTIVSGYAKFLDIHYKGVEALPGEEPDGCNPVISPFEIAAQSWITYGLQGDRDKQQSMERMTIARKPENVIDGAWKVVALTWMDRTKYKNDIDDLIQQLYRYQKPNGQWPYQFDAFGEPADFISYNVLWALAEAGHRPETDARMRLTYEYCLQMQRPEGSWQGLPTYKGFNTPFRDTQFAVLALSKLFPGDGGKGYEAGFPKPPGKFSADTGKFLEEADMVWAKITPAQSNQLRQILKRDKQVLARESAARALGRAADSASTADLAAALGDESKLVQRAAAQALRDIAIRRQAGSDVIAASLASKDARTRWGALRIFNQHFRDLTSNDKLLAGIARDLNDPAPQNRFQSAWALSRWYSWQNNQPAERQKILTALIGQLGSDGPQMTNTRRGLVEAIYTLLDENTGYLQAWIKASAKPEDHDRIENGYEAVAAEQAGIIAKALRTGNASEREGLMLALWDFHVRHMTVPDKKSLFINLPATFTEYTAGVPDLHRPGYEYAPYRETANWVYDVHSPFQQVRIGNDSELIHFFRSSGPELEQALVGILQGADDASTRINALKAGSTLAEAGGPLWAASALKLVFDPDQDVRDTVRYVYEQGGRGILNFQGGTVDPKLRATLLEILASKNSDGLAVVLPMIARFQPESAWAEDRQLAETVRAMLASSKPGDPHYPAMIEALAAFPSMLADPELHQALTASLNGSDQPGQRSAMLVILKTLLRNPNEARFATLLADLPTPARGVLIDELNSRRYFTLYASRPAAAQGEDSQHYVNSSYSDDGLLRRTEIRETVIAMLQSSDPLRRAAALDLAGKRKVLADAPDVRHEIALLRTDSDLRIQRLAASLLAGKDLAKAFRPEELAQLLDYKYFVEKVEPILAKTGGDGKACVICHNSHAIFKLQPPLADGKFADSVSHDNFNYALRVINIAQPESSLILIKPTRPSDAAGDVNTYESTHNGGQRWPGNEASPEYQTILAWIRGARLNTNVATK